MSNPRSKQNSFTKILRTFLSSFFHLGFLAILIFAFAVSLDADRMFDLALDSITIIEDVKYVMGALLFLYLIVISLHFAEIIVEVRKSRQIKSLKAEINSLKAQIFDLKQEDERVEGEMKALRDSLEDPSNS